MKVVSKIESLVIDFKTLEELKAYYEAQRDKPNKKPFYRHVRPIYWADNYSDVMSHKRRVDNEIFYSYAYPSLNDEAKGYTLELNIYYER